MNIITFITISWFHYYYIRRAWSRQENFGKRALSARVEPECTKNFIQFQLHTEYRIRAWASSLQYFTDFYTLLQGLNFENCFVSMMLFRSNITRTNQPNKIWGRSCDLSRPQISFLEGLPVEWRVSIARCSTLSAAASFASSSKSVVGRQYWYHDGPNRLNMKCFSVSWKKKRIATSFAINA